MKRRHDLLGQLTFESTAPGEPSAKAFGLTRDPDYINERIVEKDGTFYCKEPCSIQFPEWYMKQEMGEYGEEIRYYGVFIIVMGDRYSVSTVTTIVRSNPVNITTTKYEDTTFIKLDFGKDDPIFVTSDVVQETLTSYNFFKNYFTHSRIPWFIEPDDLKNAMTNLVKYAASGVGAVPVTNEIMVSVVTRSDEDPHKYYRQVGNKGPFRFVPITDVHYSVKSTVNKIAGSYMQEGITSALITDNEDEVATDIEKHLKV